MMLMENKLADITVTRWKKEPNGKTSYKYYHTYNASKRPCECVIAVSTSRTQQSVHLLCRWYLSEAVPSNEQNKLSTEWGRSS